MIEKRTILDQIEIRPNGIIQVRFLKQLVENGKVLSTDYHRTSITPGVDCDLQMANVNDHLKRMGGAEVEDYQQLKDHVAVAHSDEVISKYLQTVEQK